MKKEIREALESVKEFEKDYYKLTEESRKELLSFSAKRIKSRVKRARKIMDLISTVQKDEVREKLEKAIKPIIWENETTYELAQNMVLKAEGLWVDTPKIIIVLDELLPQVQNFCEMFPKYGRYEEREEDETIRISWVVEFPKSLLDSKSKKR